jgi:fatty-acyl-CoA synthase
MAGYWDDPRQTAEVLRDGWLDTRDLGFLDQAGYLHLTGRSQEVIMVNAHLCHPGPIERALDAHPDVGEACVVGVPDESTGEAVHAFLVAAAGRTPDHGVLRDLVRAQLGPLSVPARITEVPAIPVATSGKTDKRALLARLTAPR